MNDRSYCYEGSSVLINKFGIRDSELLNTAERKFTMLRLMDLLEHPIPGNFNFQHLCDIHYYIFQDIYEWAGQMRTVEIAKGNMFCRCEFLEAEAHRIFSAIQEDLNLKNFTSEKGVERLAYHFSEINALHPFREGNGRAQREFIRALARSQGYKLEFSKANPDEMMDASKASFLCDYVPMENLFKKCTEKIR